METKIQIKVDGVPMFPTVTWEQFYKIRSTLTKNGHNIDYMFKENPTEVRLFDGTEQVLDNVYPEIKHILGE